MGDFFARHFKTFSRSQLTALLATVIDFGSLLIMVEYLHVHYVAAVAIAAALGAFTNYTANRFWAFESDGSVPREMSRYALVSAGSLGWNTAGVWLLVSLSNGRIVYYWAKIVVAITVGVVWNYPLQKYWVFASEKDVSHA
jgi:putative flippase GtrA